MNEIIRSGAVPTAAKSQQALPMLGGKAPQGGKSLPPVVGAEPVPRVDVRELPENNQESLRVAVARMNEYVQSTQRDLHFSYDWDSGQTVVKVLDRSTQEVIRQIPDEIFLRLAETLDTEEPIHLFSARV